MSTRCKFTCIEVTKRKHWDPNKSEFHYDAKFSAVTSGSDENQEFYAATPSGTLTVQTYLPDMFEPGKDYYLDISTVPG